MEKMIKVMVFEPGKVPYTENIKNISEAYKSIVGGEIRKQPIDKNTMVISNMENNLSVLRPNRMVGNEIICGTFLLVGVTEQGEYTSLFKAQTPYYYMKYNEPETFTEKEVKENHIYGTNAIGKNSVYINNLSLRMKRENVNLMSVSKSYNVKDKTSVNEFLKLMHDEFCKTYGTDNVENIKSDNGECFFYLPAVIKSKNSENYCVGLVLVDIESSGEHWETQFVLDGGFYRDDEDMTTTAEKERRKIGVYDYWYTPDYYGDIHSDKSTAPKEVREMLEYARESNEQIQGMDMNLM